MAKARVEITATNNMSKGLKAGQKSLNQFAQQAQKVGDTLKKAFAVTSIAVALKKISSSMKECVNAFSEADKVSQRLNAVWTNVGKASGKTAKEISDYAEALEKETFFTGEAIKESALLLAATESLTQEGFDRALQASMDLAAALGEDVTSAASTLAKAMEDPEAALSRLKTIGVTFTDDEKKQIKALQEANDVWGAQEIILGKVEQKYKGVAQAINNTPVGTINNINDVLTDIRENLGEGILNAISPVLEDIYGWLTDISDWVYKWKNGGISRGDQAQIDAANAAIAVYQKGYIGGLDDYRALEAGSPILNASYKNEEDPLTKQNYRKMFSGINDMIDEYIGEITEAVQKAWSQGQISSDRMAQLIRDDLELEGDAISKEVREFFEGLLNDWDNVLSPSARAANRQKAIAGVNDFVSANGNGSTSYLISQLDSKITSAWNMYSQAIVQGMDTEAGYIMEMINGWEEEKTNLLSKGTKEVVSEIKTFIDKFSDKLASLIPSSWGTSEQAQLGIGKVLSNATESFGEAGEVMSELAQNMATMGPIIGAIVTALKYVIEGLAEVLGPIINDLLQYGLEPLREIGRVIGELLLPLLEVVLPLAKDSAESFIGVLDMIGEALKPVISTIANAIRPILDQLGNTLKFIEPIIKAITKVLVSFTGVVEYIGQVLTHWVAVILNWLAGLNIFGWKPFEGLRITDPGAPGNFSEFMDKRYSGIDAASESATLGTSSQLAVSSASYRGATSVTINIYAEGPIVGDGGMREFAQMIREEFDALNYYGVSA